jgi:muconate cycloisomerase
LGLKRFKIKTGVLPVEKDVERLREIKKILPPDAQLRIDYNQGLSWEQAMISCRRCAEFQPTYMEQPVKMWDIEGMARIAAAIDVPISADESVFSIHDCLNVIKAGAADIISIKIAKHGGLCRSKKVAAIAEAAGLPCYAGAMWESGLGVAASLQVTCSTPNIIYGSDYYIPFFFMDDDLIKEPLKIEDGYMLVPHGPGLGVEVDEDAVNKYRL